MDAPLANPGQCGDPGDRLGYSPNLRSQPPRLPSEMGVGWQHLFRMRLYVMGSVPSVGDRTFRDVRGEPVLAATAGEAIRRPLAFINPILIRPATVCQAQFSRAAFPLLFDHLVGSGGQRHGNVETKSLGGLEVDIQDHIRRLLDGKLRRTGPFQNAINIACSALP